jgi:molybdenum cofactor cytidylyltransferase
MVPVADADGGILAHATSGAAQVLRKGTVLTEEHLRDLKAAGIAEVRVARLDAGDIAENEAAGGLARAAAGHCLEVEPPFTGRANLHAEAAGVLVVDRDAIDRFNRVDPAITLATLPAFARVAAGQMAGTVKIIPFGVAGEAVRRAEAIAAAAPLLRVAPFRPLRVGLVATTLPGLKPTVMDKTRRITEQRLQRAGAPLLREIRVPHDAAAVAAALRELCGTVDLTIVFGASATVDREDAVPAGIVAAGGRIVHFGMPVDPGNLLVLGELDGQPVIGAPGCARSPRDNGFDWVLDRLLAGLEVGPDDLTGMGVGGLLAEITTRPQPRTGAAPEAANVAAVVLAGGRGTRMGGPNKLLAEIDGTSLVRHAVEAALASRASRVVVVTGHAADAVSGALAGLPVEFVHNPLYTEGLSTSLRAGLVRLSPEVDAAFVVLADMPFTTAENLNRIVAAYAPDEGALIVVPTHQGKRGNPVLWSRRFFADLMAVSGDTGGRHLIGAHADHVVEVEIGPSVLLDLDTPEALAASGGRIPS